jgi:hypothetical protein
MTSSEERSLLRLLAKDNHRKKVQQERGPGQRCNRSYDQRKERQRETREAELWHGGQTLTDAAPTLVPS